MRATLKQVADDTGLSIATVSRALRRKKRRYSVNEEKIYAAARKLGYPFIGETDTLDKTTIALVTEIRQGEFYSSLFHGLHVATRDSKSDIVFVNVDGALDNNYNWKEDPVNYIIKLSKKYNGICLFLPSLSKESYAAIKKGVGSGGNFEFASSNELWRASLDIIEFMPLTSANYSGGIIITDWYSNNNNPNETIKITIRFLSNEIRSDAVDINVFYKKCDADFKCVVQKNNKNIESELRREILKKATIYQKQTRAKNKSYYPTPKMGGEAN